MPDLLGLSIDYPAFTRTHSCLVCGDEKVDAHHLKKVGTGNNRQKPSYRHLSCVSLCRLHHGEVHSMGYEKFYKKYKVNLWEAGYQYLVEFISGVEAPFFNDRGLR